MGGAKDGQVFSGWCSLGRVFSDGVFSGYLDPAFRYVWSQGPARVRSREDALRDGLNCVALAHLAIRDLFGYALPARMQALELFGDSVRFEAVADADGMEAGDLVWFGVASPRVALDEFVPRYDGEELVNFGDFPVKHVAICTGTRDGGDHLLLHASSAEGTNALWPLRRFGDCDRYRRVYGIRRLREEVRRPGADSLA
jgi:hypothetical protein